MTDRSVRRGALAAPVKGLVVALGLLACAPAAAQKIGFVNLPKVLDKAPQSEAARHRLEKEFAPRDRELLSKQKALRALEDKLVKNAAVLSADERTRQEAQIRAKKREIQRMQDAFNEDLNIRRSQELTDLQKKVADIIQNLARSQHYDLVMTGGVVYAGERVDLTNAVIERLKKDAKGKGG